MKTLDTATINFLTDAVKTAHSVKIPNIVIDKDGLRGIDPDSKLVVILKPHIDVEFPFESIALGDVSRFLQRLNIHNDNKGSSISAELNKTEGVISLKFKSKGLNIEYRCVKSSLFDKVIPKRVNDEMLGVISIDEDAIQMLKSGQATMKSETVMFYKPTKTDAVQFVMTDDTKSEFVYDLPDPFFTENEGDELECTFANNYPIATIMAAIKDADTNEMIVGVNGSITIIKNDINITIPRRV